MSIDRSRSHVIALAILITTGFAVACKSQAPPNVILVSLDTVRADHLGAYGYERDTSPNVDALARESVLFEQAISQAPSTLPSHRSLFRSRIPSHRAEEAPPIAEVFRKGGYRTAAFTGGGNISAKFGFDRGFESYGEAEAGFTNSFAEVEAWIRAHRSEPFFLFLHTYAAHLPYDPAPPYDTLFLPEYKGPVQGKDTTELLPRIRHLRKYTDDEGEVTLTQADRDKVVSLYDGDIRSTDEYVGRLVKLLRESGLWDRTILVVLSDHGEEFWDHGSVLHAHTVFQELVHVPLIVKLPENAHAGERVSTQVRLLDVAPTLYELAGLPAPPHVEGASLGPLMRRESTAGPGAMAQSSAHRAWIRYPWKLIETRPDKGRKGAFALHELTTDPDEKTDLAPRNPHIAERLRKEMAQAMDGEAQVPVRVVEPERADPELLERLKALGYMEDIQEDAKAARSATEGTPGRATPSSSAR